MPRVVDRTVRVVDAACGVADVVLRAAPRQVPVRISRRALLVAWATGQERAVRERRVRPHAGGRVGSRGSYVESGEREGEWGERVHRAARAGREGKVVGRALLKSYFTCLVRWAEHCGRELFVGLGWSELDRDGMPVGAGEEHCVRLCRVTV